MTTSLPLDYLFTVVATKASIPGVSTSATTPRILRGMTGEITLRPGASTISIPGIDGTHAVKEVTCDLTSDGELSFDGDIGAQLISNQIPGSSPEGWNWLVIPNLKDDAGNYVHIEPYVINGAPGATVDLDEVAPVGFSEGVQIIRGEKGDPGDDADATAAQATADAALAKATSAEAAAGTATGIAQSASDAVSQTLVDAKAYADSKAAEALSEAKAFTDVEAVDAIETAKAYTDSQVSTLETIDADNLAAAKAYTDQAVAGLGTGGTDTTAANAYTDAKTAETLAAANTYADQSEADAKAYSDAALAPVATQAATADSLAAEAAGIAMNAETMAFNADAKAQSAIDAAARSYTDSVAYTDTQIAALPAGGGDSAATLAAANAYTDEQIATVSRTRNVKVGGTDTSAADSGNQYAAATIPVSVNKQKTVTGLSFHAVETGNYLLHIDGIQVASVDADVAGSVYKFEGFSETLTAGNHTASISAEAPKRVHYSNSPNINYVGADWDFSVGAWQEVSHIASYSIPLIWWLAITTNGTLEELDNVADSGVATNGQVLTYDAGTDSWIPKTPEEPSLYLHELNDVADALGGTRQHGDVLTYNAGMLQWEAQAPAGGGEVDSGWHQYDPWAMDPGMAGNEVYYMRRLGNVVQFHGRTMINDGSGSFMATFNDEFGNPVFGFTPIGGTITHTASVDDVYSGMDPWQAVSSRSYGVTVGDISLVGGFQMAVVNREFDPTQDPSSWQDRYFRFSFSYLTADDFPLVWPQGWVQSPFGPVPTPTPMP